jgi:ATP-dependent protease ClpP protease subunit
MSLIKLPEIHADARMSAGGYDLRQDIVARWAPEVRAASTDEGPATISMYDQIGESWDGSGWTSARVSAILRSVGANTPVTVNLNSPGGDFFEGVSIYNLLRGHGAEVTVNVMGLAASAASVIAMAGDKINMGEGAFLMIHKAWCVAGGNADDLTALASTLTQFDGAMADLYAARTGMDSAKCMAMMQAETWLGATQAVKDGFAHAVLSPDKTGSGDAGQKKAKALVEASLMRAGHSSAVRAETMAQVFQPAERRDPSNVGGDNPQAGAGFELAALLNQFSQSISG